MFICYSIGNIYATDVGFGYNVPGSYLPYVNKFRSYWMIPGTWQDN